MTVTPKQAETQAMIDYVLEVYPEKARRIEPSTSSQTTRAGPRSAWSNRTSSRAPG
jgi:hypothetical protein